MRHLGYRHSFEHRHEQDREKRHARRKRHLMHPVRICHMLPIEVGEQEYSERIEEEVEAGRHIVYHPVVYVEESNEEQASRKEGEERVEGILVSYPSSRPEIQERVYCD